VADLHRKCGTLVSIRGFLLAYLLYVMENLLPIWQVNESQPNQMGDLGRSPIQPVHANSVNNINKHLETILAAAEIDETGLSFIDIIEESQLIEWLQTRPENTDSELLLKIIQKSIVLKAKCLLDLTRVALAYAQPQQVWVATLIDGAYSLALGLPEVAIELSKLCLQLAPEDIFIWFSYAFFHTNQPDYQRTIEAIRVYKQRCLTPYWQVRSCYSLLYELNQAGYFEQAANLLPEFKAALLAQLAEGVTIPKEDRPFHTLIGMSGILQYFQDNPQEMHSLQHQVAQKYETAILRKLASNTLVSVVERKRANKKIKVGYIGHTLRAHSVGWLCRWLIQHHNHDEFHITTYHVNQLNKEEFTKTWFIDPADAAYALPGDFEIAAHMIRQHEIDILIDLDSMTYAPTCAIMATRSAPVQATWLGYDASGLSAIDYFIADPFVLPQNAQDYYQEEIWRLPQTYIAVEGFEVGVPDISRESLNIPTDAVVYYSSQAGSKRNSANVFLQMQILKAVPNSILLVKGLGDQSAIQEMFTDIAQEVEISLEKIRFLEHAPSELVHRANMNLADVVLDTYPYTGATTTLEALWMGIPVVTKVGQQFAARNSYAFMTNTGVKDGIAHTDNEYVQWGIRFGTDRDLRHKVMWQLQQSRNTSPLWDVKAFTQQMETAYRQMWEIYCHS
jgi:predicted O-linked N-acetylglucosamine transferase (SPINDLY family)